MRSSNTLQISFSDAPVDPQRLLADKKALIERETFESAPEYIPCPGGCGGKAFLENPLTVTRAGTTRTIRVAQCEGPCRHEIISPRTGRARSVIARFDIPCDPQIEEKTKIAEKTKPPLVEEDTSVETAPLSQFAQELNSALERSGLSQTEAGNLMGCSQSSVSKMLRDLPVADSTLAGARAWVKTILDSPTDQAFNPEKKPSNGRANSSHEEGPLYLRDGQTAALDLSSKPQYANGSAKPFQPGELSPYEAILKTILENAAKQHLEELAGPLAKNIVARVSLEWKKTEDL